MKKLISGLSALLTVAMLIPPMSAFAATEIKPDTVPPEGGLTVKYDVDPSYTVSIPAAVTLSDADVTADITASNVILEDGKQIKVDLTAASNTASGSTFNAKNGDSAVTYTITGDEAIAVGDTVATFTADGSKTLTFSAADKSAATVAGSHTETLTFNIAVEDALPSSKTITIEGYTITYNDNDTWAQIAATNDKVTITDENIVKIDGRTLMNDNGVVRHNHTINPGVSYYLGF